MTFRVGQKVVSVPCKEVVGTLGLGCPIRSGEIYTIREIDMRVRLYGVVGLRFAEIKNPLVEVIGILDFYGDWEIAYDARGFRPAVERKTDISIFEKMLTPDKSLITSDHSQRAHSELSQ